MNTLKNIPSLDLAKFLCALLILFYHYFSEQSNPIPWVLEESLSLYAVAVALFMSISGFLVYRKLATLTTRVERWCYIKKQVGRILLIYGLWSIPYLIFNISRWNVDEINLSFVLWQIQGWVFKSTFYTIWFMPSLALGLLLSFLISEYVPSVFAYVIAFFLFCIGSMTLTYASVGNILFDNWQSFCKLSENWLGGSRGWLFYGFPFVMLGRYIACRECKLSWILYFSVACCSVALIIAEALLLRKLAHAHTGIDMTLMMIPTIFFIICFLINFTLPSGMYAFWMRKMSVCIFMSQRLFLTVIPALLPAKFQVFNSAWHGAFVICGSTLIFSIILIWSGDKIQLIRRLY